MVLVRTVTYEIMDPSYIFSGSCPVHVTFRCRREKRLARCAPPFLSHKCVIVVLGSGVGALLLSLTPLRISGFELYHPADWPSEGRVPHDILPKGITNIDFSVLTSPGNKADYDFSLKAFRVVNPHVFVTDSHTNVRMPENVRYPLKIKGKLGAGELTLRPYVPRNRA